MTVLDYFDRYARDYAPYKGGPWCYEDGCIYRGLTLLHRATGEARWLEHLLRLTAPQIGADGTLAGYRPEEFNIDHILAGRCLFHLADVTGEARYMAAAGRLAGQLARHPRTASGNYWHKQVYPEQVWLDGLYMGLPFQVEYGQRSGQPALIADAQAQLARALALTARPDGLHVHGHDAARVQPWADPETGQSPAVWARAMGWLAMALVDMVALTGAPAAETRRVLAVILAEARPSGLWPQVLAAPTLAGNYEESSASAMFAYALAAAARLGVGPEGSAQAAAAARARLLAERLRPDAATPGGPVRLQGICHVAGLGPYGGTLRDGTPGYYLTEPIVADDPKGVGPLMMAVAEGLLEAARPLQAAQ